MVQITLKSFPVFFPFRSRPLIGGAGIAGNSHRFPFRDVSGIAGKVEAMTDLFGDDLPLVRKNDRPQAAAPLEVLKARDCRGFFCELDKAGDVQR